MTQQADLGPIQAERLRATRRTETDLLAAWTAQISSAPDLRGALCRGSSEWDYDREREPGPEREARLARAVATCQHCPVLEQCRTWVDGLPKHRRPYGAVGGRIIRPPGVRVSTVTAADRARVWLVDYLGHGQPVPVAQVLRAGAAHGLSPNTLRHVRPSVGVERLPGLPARWVLATVPQTVPDGQTPSPEGGYSPDRRVGAQKATESEEL
ncbi:hypothetical protein [Mycolicibacterium sp. XJ879]